MIVDVAHMILDTRPSCFEEKLGKAWGQAKRMTREAFLTSLVHKLKKEVAGDDLVCSYHAYLTARAPYHVCSVKLHAYVPDFKR